MAVEALRPNLDGLLSASLASAWWVKAMGWLGQAFFAGRVLIQWYASERARRPVAPRMFWYLSAVGAVLMSAYCVLRGEIVLLPGFLITLCIYVRNVWLSGRDPKSAREMPLALIVIALALAVGPAAFGYLNVHDRPPPTPPWLAVAIIGQIFWIGRFLIQWRHAEKQGKSEFPPAFWWMTIAGGSLMTVYSLNRLDFPLIFGFVTSWVFPLRNLILHRRHQHASS